MSGAVFRLSVCATLLLCGAIALPEAAPEGFLYYHLGNRYQVAAKDGFTYTYTHNLNNQYTHIHGEYVWGLTEDAYPEYDDNGNLQTDKWGRQYSYDYRNRLTEIGDVQYGYDALGRRVSKYDENNNLTTYFYYDTFGRVIAEYEKPNGGDEAFARSFVYGNGIDEVLAMFLTEKSFDPNDVIELAAFCEDWLTSNATYDFDSSGVVDFNDFAVLADDSWSLPTAKETHFYYLKDALGSVVGIVGGRFQRVSDREFYLYDVYGKLADASVPSAAGNPYFFTGRRRDPESGLYYFRARTYDPETGRFVQTDPIGYVDSMNLYEYVVSNPTNWVDPYGLKSLYKDQWSWWDRFRFENGMIGGWFGLSHDQTRRMDNYWLQYQRAQMLNQHPNEAKEYCKAAKSIASGCAKKAVMGYCEYIVFVDENGYGAVREKIIGYVAEPYTNRILMCYEYNGQDIDQAIADACNWQMVGADLVGLTDMSYGVDYLQGKESIDTTTGRTFSGEEQIVRGFQGTSKFCGTVAACAEGVMSCGTAIAGARTAPSNEVSWNNGWRTADGKFASPQGPGLPGAAAESAVWDAVEAKPGWQVIRGRVSVRDASGQLRVYDGAAIPPGKNYAIGLEVKSGTSPYRGSQRAFDSVLNSSGGNSLQGLGNNSDLWIRRALETRK